MAGIVYKPCHSVLWCTDVVLLYYASAQSPLEAWTEQHEHSSDCAVRWKKKKKSEGESIYIEWQKVWAEHIKKL